MDKSFSETKLQVLISPAVLIARDNFEVNIGPKFFSVKYFQYFLAHQFKHKVWVLKKNRLIETVLLSTHNICFA